MAPVPRAASHSRFMSATLAVALTLQMGFATAQDVVLKLHHPLSTTSTAHEDMLVPWAERVREASKGRLRINIFGNMTLGGSPDQLVEQVRTGEVDMIWTANGYTPGAFPRTEVFELPFVHTNDAVATNLAMSEMFDKHLKRDYRGVRVLFLHVHAGNAIHTVSTPVRVPGDLERLRLRAPSRTAAWAIEALGASALRLPITDLPTALSDGVVDGAFAPFEIVRPLGLHKLTKHQTQGPSGTRFGTSVFHVAVNDHAWEKLPIEVQRVLIEHSGEAWQREIGRLWMDGETDGIEALNLGVNKIVELTQSELEDFRTTLSPVIDKWKTEVGDRDIDADRLLEEAKALVAKYERP